MSNKKGILKYKNKIIAAGVILAVLAISWVWSGNFANKDGKSAGKGNNSAGAMSSEVIVSPPPAASIAPSAAPLSEELPIQRESAKTIAGKYARALAKTADAAPEEELAEASASPETTPSAEPTPTQNINPATGKDAYATDPVPEGKPLPVEPQDMAVGSSAYTCTLSVRCDTLLSNMHALDPDKHELVPHDGVIFAQRSVTFYEGESVFNVLNREMRRDKMHMEFRNTPIYNSAYIEGINNLYEFDCGELSGWMYKVNGWFPNYGCSRYQLQPGDVIEWVYTCDLGRDVGGTSAVGGQNQ